MAQSKGPLTSKTIIANTAVVVTALVAYFAGQDVGDWVGEFILAAAPVVVALVNIVLRFMTSKPMSISG